ncbi:hypothetical protein Taro_042700 [Colocasia esculenta]|uniref:Uncharacterized protein n=1 Tax=Colocasia esculenta TaxID=4460 RepID=A0A843WHJ2_COLES|nr:hypothetical protein [Colocasia esculenta]
MLLMVFKGQSKVRLLPLGRLRSRKTKNPSLHPLKKKATTTVSRSGRRQRLRRVHNKASRHPLCRVISFHGAMRFWVRRRQQRRRDPSSDTLHVATSLLKSGRNATRAASRSSKRQGHCRDQYRFPPQRRSLSRPHIPCVRLEHSLEGLHKSPLTVDSHTVSGLVVPVAT